MQNIMDMENYYPRSCSVRVTSSNTAIIISLGNQLWLLQNYSKKKNQNLFLGCIFFHQQKNVLYLVKCAIISVNVEKADDLQKEAVNMWTQIITIVPIRHFSLCQGNKLAMKKERVCVHMVVSPIPCICIFRRNPHVSPMELTFW